MRSLLPRSVLFSVADSLQRELSTRCLLFVVRLKVRAKMKAKTSRKSKMKARKMLKMETKRKL